MVLGWRTRTGSRREGESRRPGSWRGSPGRSEDWGSGHSIKENEGRETGGGGVGLPWLDKEGPAVMPLCVALGAKRWVIDQSPGIPKSA